MQPYKIIYADPPWAFNDKMKGHSFSLDHEYETQTADWINSIPVKDIAAPDSVLFLWAVSALLPEAMAVIDAWGFKYKTVAFCWIKSSSQGRLLSNLGRWTMSGMELFRRELCSRWMGRVGQRSSKHSGASRMKCEGRKHYFPDNGMICQCKKIDRRRKMMQLCAERH